MLYVGDRAPYGDFLGEAAGDFVAEQTVLATVGGIAAAGASVATAAAIVGATSAILPYAISGTLATGGTYFAGVAAAAAAVVGPAVIVGAGVAGAVARAVQVADEQGQKDTFNRLVGMKNKPLELGSLSLKDDSGKTDPVSSAILMGAIASLLGGAF